MCNFKACNAKYSIVNVYALKGLCILIMYNLDTGVYVREEVLTVKGVQVSIDDPLPTICLFDAQFC